MSEKPPPNARLKRLMAAQKASLPALTVFLARDFLADYPDYWFVWALLASALIDLARYEEAEQALSEVLERCTADERFTPLYYMGILNARQGKLEYAAEWFRRMIESAPRDNSGYIGLEVVLFHQGRLRDAEEVLRKSIETCYEGCLDEAFLHLGNILRSQERYEEAAECFREAIHLDPEYRLAHRALRDVERCLKIVKRRS